MSRASWEQDRKVERPAEELGFCALDSGIELLAKDEIDVHGHTIHQLAPIIKRCMQLTIFSIMGNLF